jgi:hypothetical protein
MLTEMPETTTPGGTQPDVALNRSRPTCRQVMNAAIAVALALTFAGVIALLIIAQPFADAVGGCGGG